MLASVLVAAHGATRKGRLNKVDALQVRHLWHAPLPRWPPGRRVQGVVRDVRRRAVRYGFRCVSLDQEFEEDADRPLHLRECLADHDAENPYDVARRTHDPSIFDAEAVSVKAKATFRFLAETRAPVA